MLRLVDSPAWIEWSATLAGKVKAGGRVGVRLTALPERLVALVRAAVPDAVHVHVPTESDQAERILLALGESLGKDSASLVDKSLRTAPDETEALLGELGLRLGNRPLLVDGWDAVGVTGLDRDLGLALRARADALRRWFNERSGLFVGRSSLPKSAQAAEAPREAPVLLGNGAIQDTASLWEDLHGDSGLYGLSLAGQALGVVLDDEPVSDDGLRVRIRELLPEGVSTALRLVALHARPVPAPFLRHFGITAEAVDLGRELGLWAVMGEEVVVEPGWTEHFHKAFSREARERTHIELANAFLSEARPGDPSAVTAGVSILEAHRHLVAAGDFERAKDCMRYGVTLLIEAAREQSIAKQFSSAARLYGSVIDAADAGRIVLPKRLRAYARHYLHFNRGHGDLEAFAATEGGYRKALEDWPENALFWSRLVRVMCFQDKPAGAFTDLAEAQAAVESHPQKQTFLVARTVRGLLDKGRLLDAVRIWGHYKPDTPYARDVESQLARSLAAGWSTERLILDPDAPLVFQRPVEVRVVSGAGSWSAEVLSLDAFGTATRATDALLNLVKAIRDEVARLVRAYSSDLSPRDRLRKRVLLGAVDILASRIEAPPPDGYWYFGTLHRRETGGVLLRTGGDRDLWFEVPEGVVGVVDDLPHLALVSIDHRGVPVGPVKELRPGFRGSDEELWEAWRRLLANAG